MVHNCFHTMHACMQPLPTSNLTYYYTFQNTVINTQALEKKKKKRRWWRIKIKDVSVGPSWCHLCNLVMTRGLTYTSEIVQKKNWGDRHLMKTWQRGSEQSAYIYTYHILYMLCMYLCWKDKFFFKKMKIRKMNKWVRPPVWCSPPPQCPDQMLSACESS